MLHGKNIYKDFLHVEIIIAETTQIYTMKKIRMTFGSNLNLSIQY